MQFCTRCLYTDQHPLHLTFDKHGVCSGCRIHDEKDVLDWRERGERLRIILEQYRCRSGNNYDCIVPVSGARDSYFIVHTIKNVYRMNPLLVTYNKQYNTAQTMPLHIYKSTSAHYSKPKMSKKVSWQCYNAALLSLKDSNAQKSGNDFSI